MKFAWLKKKLTVPINAQSLYLGALSFYLFFSFLRNTTFDPYLGTKIFNLASYLAVLMVLIKIIVFDFNYLTFLQKLFDFFMMLIAIIIWRKSTSNLILVMTFFILGARNVSFNAIIRCYFYVSLILLISVIFCSLFGVIRNLVFNVQGRAVRYSLGIIYPTDLAAHILYLMLAHAYINFSKLNWWYYLVYLIIAFIVKSITDARLSFICMLFMILVFIIAQTAHSSILSYNLMRTSWMWTPILAFSMFVATYFFTPQNKIYSRIDHLLSGRLGYGHLATSNYPLTLWGQKIVEHGFGGNGGLRIFGHSRVDYFYIDSSYIRLVMIYGIIAALIYVTIVTLVSLKGIKHHVYKLAAVILVVTISCLIEQHLLELSYNPFLLALFAKILYRKGKNNEQRKNVTG